MKQLVWVKTIMEIYRHLEIIANTIDEIAHKEVYRSFSEPYRTTLDSVETLIELNERKKKMINMKLIIENAIVKLRSVKDQRLIALYFVDGMTCNVVAERLKLSLRTFFRRKTNALNELVTILNNQGYPLHWWLNEYKDESWLMQQYHLNLVSEEETCDLKKYRLLKSVQEELKHI